MNGKSTTVEKAEELRQRTKQLALRVFRLCNALPRSTGAQVVAKQLLRSATSTAANYRAACRARSKPDFVAKIGVVVEEADETVFWLDFLSEADVVKPERLRALSQEAHEILAIMAAAQRTARKGRNS